MKWGQKRGWGVQRHPYSTPHPLSGTPYPRSENALRWLGKWPRYWGGGPVVACRRARPPPTPPRGDGTARKESIMGPAGQAQPSSERYVRSGGGTKVAGEMSMGMEAFPLPDEAAGRRGIASRSMSWSWRVTMALAAEIRSLAGAVVSSTRSAIRSADRRSRKTICPGKVALAIPITA